MAFAENLKHLPKVSHLLAIELIDAEGGVAATIENKPGQAGSLAVYNHLGQIYGAITAEAAKKGLELYAEHAADAQIQEQCGVAVAQEIDVAGILPDEEIGGAPGVHRPQAGGGGRQAGAGAEGCQHP